MCRKLVTYCYTQALGECRASTVLKYVYLPGVNATDKMPMYEKPLIYVFGVLGFRNYPRLSPARGYGRNAIQLISNAIQRFYCVK